MKVTFTVAERSITGDDAYLKFGDSEVEWYLPLDHVNRKLFDGLKVGDSIEVTYENGTEIHVMVNRKRRLLYPVKS